MKSPINTYEAIGIFGSVAIMSLVLVFLGLKTEIGTADIAESTGSQGALVVANEDSPDNQGALSDALVEASPDGERLSKLVVDDVRIGTGEAAEEGDRVTVHYIGSTRDGVQFDSSYQRNEPFTFTIGEGKVIEGWEAGVPGMQVGGQRILVIPPDMAYGNRKVGPIDAGSVLVFAVELLSVD